MAAGEAANMAKYAAGEAVCNAVDRAIQTHGGNGLANEYGLVQMLAGSRLSRIAPVSQEMVLNFVAQFSPRPAEVLLRRPMTASWSTWRSPTRSRRSRSTASTTATR